MEFVTLAASLGLIGVNLWLYRRQRLRFPEMDSEERGTYAASLPTRIFSRVKGPFYALIALDLLLGPWLRPAGAGAVQAFCGLALATAGVWVLHASLVALGANFAPCDRAAVPFERVKSGPYRYYAHPIYAANLMLFGGIAIANGAWGVGAGTGLLAVFYAFSIRDEDRALDARFPADDAETGSLVTPSGRSST